jgi:hypothetical protein
VIAAIRPRTTNVEHIGQARSDQKSRARIKHDGLTLAHERTSGVVDGKRESIAYPKSNLHYNADGGASRVDVIECTGRHLEHPSRECLLAQSIVNRDG